MSGGSILPVVRYADPAEAAAWLCSAFGFSIHHVAKQPDGGTAYIVLRFGENSVVVAQHGSSAFDGLMVQPADVGNRSTQTCYLTVPDVDQHYAQTLSAGAQVEVEPSDDGIGGRFYVCRDPEGHLWSFGAPLVGLPRPGPDGAPSQNPRRYPAVSSRAAIGLAITVGVAVGGGTIYLGTNFASKAPTATIGGIREPDALSGLSEQEANAAAAKRLLVSEAAVPGLTEKMRISQFELTEAQQSKRSISKPLNVSEAEYQSRLKDSQGALDAAVRAKELASQELDAERRRTQAIQRQLDDASQQLARLRAGGSTFGGEARRPRDAIGKLGDELPDATQAGETERGELATTPRTEQLLRERLRASERESRELNLRARAEILEMDKEAARARAARDAESARTGLAATQAKQFEARDNLRTSERGTADAPARVARTAPPDAKLEDGTPRTTPRAAYFRPLPQHQRTQRRKWISVAAINKAKAERQRQVAEAAAAAARKAEEERQRLAAEAAQKAEAERQRQVAEAAAAARKLEEERQRLAAEAAQKAEAERQRQVAEAAAAARKAEEERQRLAAEAAQKAEAERQRQVAEAAAAAARKAEEERQRLAAEAAQKAEAERQRQAAEAAAAAARKAEEERQRLAAEAAQKAEEERQRQVAEAAAAAARKAEEERQRLAAEAAQKAEAERQRQAAEAAAAARKAEEERQRLAAEAAQKAEEERQRQVAEAAAAAARKAEEERQRLAAEAAQKAEIERQRQAAEAAAAAQKAEEERQRQAAVAAQKAEAERQRQAAEAAAAAARKAEEERQRLAAEAAQKAEAERQRRAAEAAAAARKAEEERQRLATEAAQKFEAERIAKEAVEAKAQADHEARQRTRSLTVTSEDGARYLARGRALLKTGDVASARLLLERASNAGLADAAMELAETYDPATVARLSAVGLVGDRERARVWYMRAQALGSSAATERLKSIVDQ